jgi:flagellin
MMDTEMADEMTTYTSLNVLTQAATSILSQANERPSTVLQILQ